MVLDAFAGQSYADPSTRKDKSSPAVLSWYQWVKQNARVQSSKHTITTAGVHRLKIWMVDPEIVLEKVILRRDALQASYFGPPALLP
ncbi:MAG: hypothetical protein KTR17_00745 [Cellvibrionaceae bacterium]|nr:hypothetical protein [Cellvibrionaceae bacterium]